MAALLRILVPKINDSYRHTVTYRRLHCQKTAQTIARQRLTHSTLPPGPNAISHFHALGSRFFFA